MLKYKVTEGVDRRTLKHSGFKMTTNIHGRRHRTNNVVTTPNGKFYGKVFVEGTETVTSDWGDGQETKTHITETVLAEIAPSTDRDLIERRTKAVFEAIAAMTEDEANAKQSEKV